MKISRFLVSLFTGAALLLPAASQSFAAQDLSLNGSTTLLPVIQKGAEAYMAAHPDVKISISGGGSGNGVKALLDGLTTIAMSSRDLKSSEEELAKKKGIQPFKIAVAIDALVPVTHPENPVKSLTIAQLRDIYMGTITNWKELGGHDAKIVVISRDTSSGTYETWEGLVMNKARVMPRALLQASSGAVVQAVSKNKNAIGYIGFGYLNPSLHALAVDNLEANPETALSGQWPIARELYLFTSGKPTGVAEGFINFMLSPEGQGLVKQVGFIPLKK